MNVMDTYILVVDPGHTVAVDYGLAPNIINTINLIVFWFNTIKDMKKLLENSMFVKRKATVSRTSDTAGIWSSWLTEKVETNFYNTFHSN